MFRWIAIWSVAYSTDGCTWRPSLQSLGPLWFFGVPTALALLCLGLDARRNHRLNPVFAAGTAVLIGSYVARLALMTTGPWLTLAAWLTSFV